MVLKTSKILLLALVAALALSSLASPQQVEPTTYCWPQPTWFHDLDLILYVHIVGEDPDQIIFESIRVQGKIRPREPVFVENGEIVTSAYIMQFLANSGFRPVTRDFQSTYTVEYDKTDGTHPVLTGEYELLLLGCDVTLDGHANLDDLIFAADYFWRDGSVPTVVDNKTEEVWDIPELLDVDGNGDINPLDIRAMMELLQL